MSQQHINWQLLRDLADKPHPLLNIEDDFATQIKSIPPEWIMEVFQQARTSHHLLDLTGVPLFHPRSSYASDLDARTSQAVNRLMDVESRLDRIKTLHSRETGSSGMVGIYCIECGAVWPCDTVKLVEENNDEV